MSIRAQVNKVSVRLGATQALDSVQLSVEPGQFLALLGPSGSGKTTALNVVAGFARPDHGTVTFDGRDVTDIPPSRRDIGIVFQGYALFPHMTVAANVDFPLRMRKVDHSSRHKRMREALELVGLADLADRSVATLSGGQKQRVALARAIVFEPRMMLLDEPLAALDKQLRDSMQLELKRLQRRLGITTIAVTHDQVEALTMADTVAVMRAGRVEQVAAPQDIYLRPATLFVATFIGEANLIPVQRGHLTGFGELRNNVSGQAVVRPEHLVVKEDAALGASWLEAKALIQEVTFQGERLRARVRLDSHPNIELLLSQPSSARGAVMEPGKELCLALDRDAVHVIPDTDHGHSSRGKGGDLTLSQHVRGLVDAPRKAIA